MAGLQVLNSEEMRKLRSSNKSLYIKIVKLYTED